MLHKIVAMIHSPVKVQKPSFSLQSLNNDELENLIKSQGKIIGMGTWEIASLVDTFRKKNSLRKAYHVLLEYSQLHNDIYKLVSKWQSYVQKILSFLNQEECPSGSSELSHVAAKIAEYALKSWVAICRWRQLQWSPRPILFNESWTSSRQRGKTGGEHDATSPVSLVKLFEHGTKDILDLSIQKRVHLIDAGVRPIHLIVILASSVATILSDSAIAKIILRTPDCFDNDWLVDDPAESLTQREVSLLLSPYCDLMSSLRDVAQTEISYDSVWKTFSSFKSSKPDEQNIPLLKLFYHNKMINTSLHDTSQKYFDTCEVLLAFLVRNFSVVPSSKKRSGGDLHSAVLKSIACINGEVLRANSPTSSSPVRCRSNNNSSSPLKAESLPRREKQKRPQSSPLERTPVSFPHGEDDFTEQLRSSQNINLQQPFEATSAFGTGDIQKPLSGSPRKGKNLPQQFIDTSEKVEHVTANKRDDQMQHRSIPSDEHITQILTSCDSDFVEESPPTKQSGESPLDVLKHGVINFNQDIVESKQELNSPPVSKSTEIVDTDIEATISGDLFLRLVRLEMKDAHGDKKQYRLVVADYGPYCPVETMQAVDIGDEVVGVGGMSMEGKKLTDVVNTVKSKVKGKNSSSLDKEPTGMIVSVKFRKVYSEKQKILHELQNNNSIEQKRIMSISADDMPALESALQQLKREVAHLEQCMECVNQKGFNNVRLQVMKKFNLMKSVQMKLSTTMLSTIESQKVEIARLESQKQYLQKGPNRDSTHRGINLENVCEDDELGSMIFSKKKKVNLRRQLRKAEIEFQYRKPHRRPLIASLHFKKHWCEYDSPENNGAYACSRRVLSLQTKSFDSNSNTTKYNFARSRMFSNDLKSALRKAEHRNKRQSREVLAARLLCAWWALVYPQKLLTLRMITKNMVLDIIEDIVVRSLDIGAASLKRRQAMLRMAAVTLIQRSFRKWKSNVLLHVMKLQRFGRRYLTRQKILKLVNIVRSAVLVARFLYRRKIRLKKIVGKRVHYKRVIRNYMEHIGYLKRDANQKDLLHLLSMGGNKKLLSSFADSKEGYIVKRRLEACIKIQSFFRMLASQWYYKYLVQEDFICKKVRCAMRILQLRKKILRKRKIRQAAVKMQRTWRGCASRWKLYLQVIAGIKITAAWRKYRQYWKLKQCLRRIEFPVEIVLHGIRNISSPLIYSKKIKVRVSVWWNSLLHLVDNKDFTTITQSKQPHIIRTTALYDCEHMPEKSLPPPLVATVDKTISTVPPLTGAKFRGGKRLSLMAQAQKINVSDSSAEENSLSAFVARQSQKTASVSWKGIVKKSVLTNRTITPVIAGDSDEESDSSSDSSSSSSCSDNSVESGEDMFDESDLGNRPGYRRSDIGSNLLSTNISSNSGTSLPPLANSNTYGSQGQSIQALRRSTMTRVSRTETGNDLGRDDSKAPKMTFSGTVNLINKGLFGFSNAFKQTQIKKKNDLNGAPKSSSMFQCSLNEETLYIPGCHGNSVIRFDIFDGE